MAESKHDCLVEIGTEELPPSALQDLARDFAALLEKQLHEQTFGTASTQVFATPRRLAVLFRGLPLEQAEQRVEKRGPALAAAFDADGQPTRAAQGFASSCGVPVDDLEQRETDKGTWLYFISTQPGRQLAELLPEMVGEALARLPMPKRMRWGDRRDEFVRPVQWLLAMIDDRVVPMNHFGLNSGSLTRGHRFHAPGAIEITRAADYEQQLLADGLVIADFDKRRDIVHNLVEQSAARLGGQVKSNPELLDEVTALVEYPVAVCGQFDASFLDLPPEVLVTTMQDNQKYFALFDESGELMPHFVAIANIDSRRPEVVASGNERVIRPRFADAEFFFAQDRQRGLDEMRTRLDAVVFQEKLGSLGDKAGRIVRLAKYIAAQTGADQDLVRRAAELCKADLMSDMVGEFPKLQGIIGRYYAAQQNEDPAVCDAIEQHYWPRHYGDELPKGAIAQAIALADRLDTLIGIFGIGQKPGGDKDPFALRRAALGVLRILVEEKLGLDLFDLCRAAADGYTRQHDCTGAVNDVIEFVFDRQRAYYQEQQIGFDIVDAVACGRPGVLYDCDRRIRAVQAFQTHEAAAALAAANKRIHNILKKQPLPDVEIDPGMLQESAESRLFAELQELRGAVTDRFAAGEYLEGLEELARLRPTVDAFFDEVMVMVDDEKLRNNRLALLAHLMQSFQQVADFSRIQS